MSNNFFTQLIKNKLFSYFRGNFDDQQQPNRRSYYYASISTNKAGFMKVKNYKKYRENS